MPQTVPFHKHAHPLHTSLLGAQVIVFVTDSLADLILQPCGAQHKMGAGFMAEFVSVFLYSICTIKLDSKPLFHASS